MTYIKDILEKATIRGVADYMLFGLRPDKDDRDYETRLEEVYSKYEEAVKRHDDETVSDLLDLANDMTSETASVYMELGLQAGILLMKDMDQNMGVTRKRCQKAGKSNDNENLIQMLFTVRADTVLEAALSEDKQYQRVNQKNRKKVKKIESIGLNKEEWCIVDQALTAANEKVSEYGRIAYQQGFKDAMSLLQI